VKHSGHFSGIAILIAFLDCLFRRNSILNSSALGQAQLAEHLTLRGATDPHAHIESPDTVSNKPAELALAKIAAVARNNPMSCFSIPAKLCNALLAPIISRGRMRTTRIARCPW